MAPASRRRRSPYPEAQRATTWRTGASAASLWTESLWTGVQIDPAEEGGTERDGVAGRLSTHAESGVRNIGRRNSRSWRALGFSRHLWARALRRGVLEVGTYP